MTAPRHDDHSTEFGLWLRQQESIDSRKGYVATNLDYIWRNYNTGLWMMIEEKRYGGAVKRFQKEIFDLLNWCAKYHPKFRGFHILRFEKTNPDNGRIFWDGEDISKERLIEILQFKDEDNGR
jgi:hypothetical protein